MIFYCLNLTGVFIINMLFIKIKVFVVNWFQWHQNLQHLFIGAPIIDENVKNALFHLAYLFLKKLVQVWYLQTSYVNITIILKLGGALRTQD